MTQPLRTIVTKVVDEYGAVFPAAEVTIYNASTAPELSIMANLDKGVYDIANGEAPIAYTAMYHVSAQTRADGRRTRPLKQEVDVVDENDKFIETKFEDTFIVDNTLQPVKDALAGAADPVESILRAIGADIKVRFA